MAGGPGGLSITLATVRGRRGFAEAVAGCLRRGIATVPPGRDRIAAAARMPVVDGGA